MQTNWASAWVHQHFKLVHNFTVLQNIILGVETTKRGLLKMDSAREKVMKLSNQYGLMVDPDALIQDITVGMQQRVEILKMLYRDNEILIFDEPTAVLTPQEIEEPHEDHEKPYRKRVSRSCLLPINSMKSKR